jgi:hypothetical protein
MSMNIDKFLHSTNEAGPRLISKRLENSAAKSVRANPARLGRAY